MSTEQGFEASERADSSPRPNPDKYKFLVGPIFSRGIYFASSTPRLLSTYISYALAARYITAYSLSYTTLDLLLVTMATADILPAIAGLQRPPTS
ncbi:hypothetical protein AJ78_07145 [Emergomyces pasteurianus Ep9510]|uniref:Uncharacterized protein n=1 Tax=Emergomyces pasteurianus Ep9510 TaxID=1447872 RepID=A0A1J9Q8F3_9EURO|nr:hypothetical protein AJ78_07145 [Emergomyces pasteurianus Ep9510]